MGPPRIFVNNVDGFLAGAVCADLYKYSHQIVGTRKGRIDELIPPVVKRIVPRLDVRRLLKVVASSDIVVYDLHDADLEELELVLRTLHISDLSNDITFILISSVGCWARTERKTELIPDAVEEVLADGEEGEAPITAAKTVPVAASQMADTAPPMGAKTTPAPAKKAETMAAQSLASNLVAETGDEAAGEAAVEEGPRRVLPLCSEDYTRRIPAPKFQEWKTIETLTLALKEKHNVRPYVVCAGVPYGNGEEAFLGLFKAAWQSRTSLRVIGDGTNCIPMVHTRDVARLVRNLVEVPQDLDYHLCVDRGQITQRELIEAVAGEFGIPYEVKSVSVAEALLAELADILTLDMKVLPSEVMNIPYVPPPVEEEEDEEEMEDQPDGAPSTNREVTKEQPQPGSQRQTSEAWMAADDGRLPFRWWCEQGFKENISKVANEFREWRALDPVRIVICGPPGCGGEQLGAIIAEKYNIANVSLDGQVEEKKKDPQSDLGKTLKETSDQIAAALANPKAPPTSVYLIPSALTMQAMEAAVEEKPAKFRGVVVSGFPQTSEEAIEFFSGRCPTSDTGGRIREGCVARQLIACQRRNAWGPLCRCVRGAHYRRRAKKDLEEGTHAGCDRHAFRK